MCNPAILHNVNAMTQILNDLKEEDFEVTAELAADLGPYRTKHLDRCGDYLLNLHLKVTPL